MCNSIVAAAVVYSVVLLAICCAGSQPLRHGCGSAQQSGSATSASAPLRLPTTSRLILPFDALNLAHTHKITRTHTRSHTHPHTHTHRDKALDEQQQQRNCCAVLLFCSSAFRAQPNQPHTHTHNTTPPQTSVSRCQPTKHKTKKAKKEKNKNPTVLCVAVLLPCVVPFFFA